MTPEENILKKIRALATMADPTRGGSKAEVEMAAKHMQKSPESQAPENEVWIVNFSIRCQNQSKEEDNDSYINYKFIVFP